VPAGALGGKGTWGTVVGGVGDEIVVEVVVPFDVVVVVLLVGTGPRPPPPPPPLVGVVDDVVELVLPLPPPALRNMTAKSPLLAVPSAMQLVALVQVALAPVIPAGRSALVAVAEPLPMPSSHRFAAELEPTCCAFTQQVVMDGQSNPPVKDSVGETGTSVQLCPPLTVTSRSFSPGGLATQVVVVGQEMSLRLFEA
jgi:hypothetical protein